MNVSLGRSRVAEENDRLGSLEFIELKNGRRTIVGGLMNRFDSHIWKEIKSRLSYSEFRSDGEDLYQEINVALFEGLPTVKKNDRKAIAKWVLTVIRNKVTDYIRKSPKPKPQKKQLNFVSPDMESVPDSNQSTASQEFDNRENIEKVYEAIEEVGEQFQPVLKYIFEEGPTKEEVFEFINKKSPEASRKHLERAFKDLRRVIFQKNKE